MILQAQIKWGRTETEVSVVQLVILLAKVYILWNI